MQGNLDEHLIAHGVFRLQGFGAHTRTIQGRHMVRGSGSGFRVQGVGFRLSVNILHITSRLCLKSLKIDEESEL